MKFFHVIRSGRKRLRLSKGLIIKVLFLCVLTTGCMTAGDKKRLAELHKLASETPLYPDFKQSGASEGAKSSVADFTVDYRSAATLDDVKRFYIRVLSDRGWRVVRGNEFGDGDLVFGKGEYQIAISYAGGEYAVSYVWRDP